MKQEITSLCDRWKRFHLASAGGQLNWVARQASWHLQAGVSLCQQMAGLDDPDALKEINSLIKRGKQPLNVVIKKLQYSMDEMFTLAVSEASYAGMPGGASQGGMAIAFAEPKIIDGKATCVIVDTSRCKIKRVVRASMGAEISNGTATYEPGDYVRAAQAEMTCPDFELKKWRRFASKRQQILVIDAKYGYDSLNSDLTPTDKRTAIDIAVLRQSLMDPEYNSLVRWVPGREMLSDGLTKTAGNGVLERVMQSGTLSLTDTPEAAELRRLAGERKVLYRKKLSDEKKANYQNEKAEVAIV